MEMHVSPTMDNPWLDLPLKPPFVLPTDADAAKGLGIDLGELFQVEQMPEPYFGTPDAEVVVLLLNPGWSPLDVAVHQDPTFQASLRDCLVHVKKDYPFVHLAPGGNMTPARRWWLAHARRLIEATSLEAVSSRLLCLEFMGYKSQVAYAENGLRLPSQQYTFHLLRRAMDRGAFVLVMRSRELWYSEVPELQTYADKALAINRRRPFLSRGNFAPGVFEMIVARINGQR